MELAEIPNFVQANQTLSKEDLFEQLYQLVFFRVFDMLQHDISNLTNFLYRIDVKENLVSQAFEYSDEKEIANKLTELIINREFEKAQSRRLYKERGDFT